MKKLVKHYEVACLAERVHSPCVTSIREIPTLLLPSDSCGGQDVACCRNSEEALKPVESRYRGLFLAFQLKELEWKQLQHDKLYHSDIWCLDVQTRLKHMVLHIAKYSSKIQLVFLGDLDDARFQEVILDMFIISLSSINIINKDVNDALGVFDGDDIDHLYNRTFSELFDENSFDNRFQILVNKSVSLLCKAIEATDHFEAFQSRSIIVEEFCKLLRVSFVSMLNYFPSVDLFDAVSDRLYQVEKRSKYFEMLGNYKDGYRCSGVVTN